jgi:phosphoribosyl-ATP pyrophosphohydrolase
MADFTLDALEAIVDDRLTEGDASSYTRQLAAKGLPKAAQKLGEEAVEAVIAAVQGDREGLKAETADLLYHLIVVLRLSGVSVGEVMAELARRTGRSGLDEKASRSKD